MNRNTSEQKTKEDDPVENGRAGSLYSGLTGDPQARKAQIAAAEEWDLERRKAREIIAELSAKRAEALKDGDNDRANEITREIRRIGCEIRDRFGY